ncbi:MAG: hypothetical protein HY561_09535 [Gemmatimonadetes bacterium]|nr:hypothetical protein [Gemmatimonadota bacterium]
MSLPTRDRLAALPLHVVVRDYPETLAVFRRLGVDVPRRGGESVSAAAGPDLVRVLDAVLEAIAWREGA